MNAAGEPTPLTLFLDGIAEGSTELVFDISAEMLELRDAYYEFPWPVHVALSLRRALETFTVSGTVSTRVSTECCRCLATTEAFVQAPVTLILQRRVASEEELEAGADADEIELVAPSVQEFDLRELVRQALVLELPLRVYCRDDCRGLCPHCGQNLNLGSCTCAAQNRDARWDALRGIGSE